MAARPGGCGWAETRMSTSEICGTSASLLLDFSRPVVSAEAFAPQAPSESTGTCFMKLAAIQFRPNTKDPSRWEESAAALASLVDRAGEQGAGLIVCPEMALTGYLFPTPAMARLVAEPAATGPTYRRFSPLGRKYRCYLVIGYPETTHQGHLYNSALVIGPDGALLANYRKRLLYESDTTWAMPGDTPYPSIDTPAGLLTAGICMDLNDDRFTAFLRRRQPAMVAFCTNWIHQDQDMRPYWRYRLRGVRSCFVAANSYGKEVAVAPEIQPETQVDRVLPPETQVGTRVLPPLTLSAHFLGHSAVLGPDGETLAIAPETGDAVLLADMPCTFLANPRK